jgi:hypothetical protein
MVRQHRIRRQLRGDEERIDRIRIRIGSRRDDGIQPAAYPNDASGLLVVRQERLLRPPADFAMGRQMVGQLLSGENRVLSEKLIMFHRRYP